MEDTKKKVANLGSNETSEGYSVESERVLDLYSIETPGEMPSDRLSVKVLEEIVRDKENYVLNELSNFDSKGKDKNLEYLLEKPKISERRLEQLNHNRKMLKTALPEYMQKYLQETVEIPESKALDKDPNWFEDLNALERKRIEILIQKHNYLVEIEKYMKISHELLQMMPAYIQEQSEMSLEKREKLYRFYSRYIASEVICSKYKEILIKNWKFIFVEGEIKKVENLGSNETPEGDTISVEKCMTNKNYPKLSVTNFCK